MKPSTLSCILLSALLYPASVTAQRPPAFHWDWHNSQELYARQSLRNAALPQHEKQVIAKALIVLLRPMLADQKIKSRDQLRKAALDTRVKLIDLNRDGIPEVVAQSTADCTATGNCSFWVFQKVQKKYKLLLQGYGQTFTIQKTRTHRFRDIVVSMHGSAFESGLTDYRFESGAYREGACYNASWQVLRGGVVYDLKRPLITPCDDY